MTTREMLDSLSGALICDDRILRAPERELLTNLLQRSATSGRANEVTKAISSCVGEILTERALEVLGDSITHQLSQQQVASASRFRHRSTVIHAGTPPSSPPNPPDGSQPRPPSPNPPGGGVSAWNEPNKHGLAILEAADILPAQCVVFDEFLAPADLRALIQDTLEREMQFQVSEVVSPGVSVGAIDFEHRRSRVLMDLGPLGKVIVDCVKNCLPRALRQLGRDPFPPGRVECQITASGHGDFFRWHNDNGAPEVASREITFVYFFHREPKKFSGGELRIYDSRWENDHYAPNANYRTVVPEQNQVILFPSALAHEITLVECQSRAFADSRFTVNGWLHK